MSDVDVVILSLNRSEMTKDAVLSIVKQCQVKAVIWIIDQGSTEDTLNLLHQLASDYSNVRLIELGRNVGIPAGRNIGMACGQAPYIVSVDNDAVIENVYALKYLVETFNTRPGVGIIGFRIMNYYTKKDDELSWAYPKELKRMRDNEFYTTRFAGGGHALRRSIFNETGGYDESLFFYWEEVELSYKALNLGYQIIYDPKIILLHKVAPESRVDWKNGRYYYLVRNAIYINYKYYGRIDRVFLLSMGYILKGIHNSLFNEAFKGVMDGIRMCRKVARVSKINDSTQNYILKNEMCYRGSFFKRLRTEVFAYLPGRNN